ncbi:MAG: MOSC domain-containing protein [Chloroflexi bacterium]|nr:MOSC domain-containing protein [Chloroflexota bacterium]
MHNMTTQTVGRVGQLWRFPVKSMAGEQVSQVRIDDNGVAGDRGWAVREAGDTRSAKQMPRLLQFAARYLEEHNLYRRSRVVELTLPDNESLTSADEDVHRRLSEVLGRGVVLTSVRPADDLDHYRRRPSDPNAEPAPGFHEVMGMEEGDPMPDFGAIQMDVLQQYSSPPGTYFDCFPIHIMTTASLNELASLGGGEDVDVRRFRPNVLIDTGDAQGLLEVDWTGKQLRMGGVTIELMSTAVRCSMPAHAQREFGASRAVGRTLIEHTKQHLGSYCNVVEGGTVNVGDEVVLIG